MERVQAYCLRTFLKRFHECHVELDGHATQIKLDAITAVANGTGFHVDVDEVRLR
jgi:hypothetical protein